MEKDFEVWDFLPWTTQPTLLGTVRAESFEDAVKQLKAAGECRRYMRGFPSREAAMEADRKWRDVY